jgi:dihydropteroate synthase
VILDLPTRSLDLSTPQIMGVLNLTPDSFSDGGQHVGVEAALAHARRMIGEGASIIDVGGESTRPSAAPVSEQEELQRVIPVIERLRQEIDCVISIDTRHAAVMAAACAAGAELINDVGALRASGAVDAALQSRAAVCLMHMQGEPGTMQQAPVYDDVVAEVATFLQVRVAACEAAGIPRSRLLIDPGFGFGKTLPHNLRLMSALETFRDLGLPLLVGVSRKSMLGQLSGLAVDQRLAPGLAAAALAVWQGARIIRTHDVAPTVEAVRFAAAVAAVR